MTIEKYLKLRNKGESLQVIQEAFHLSEGTVYTLELGYQCYLKRISLDKAIEIIQKQEQPNLVARLRGYTERFSG